MERPQAENGILYLGPWDEDVAGWISARWPTAEVRRLADVLARVDLSRTERGSCPGFNDEAGLVSLSRLHPGAIAMGFFCDGVARAEGVRIFVDGRQSERARQEWAEAGQADSMLWPIGRLALSLRLPVEAVTRVERPARPPLLLALEALLGGGEVADDELRHRALDALGEVEGDLACQALVRHLSGGDWVTRYHAVRAYVRRLRGQGQADRPRLERLLEDEDEGVREAVLEALLELIPDVAFSDRDLQAQIDAAVARGLADEDEDVRAAAGAAERLRRELLG